MHHNRIAWSRSGLLAYIDGSCKVFVTWLQCTDGEKWDFVPPVHVQAAGESTPVHLSWSATNLDLAIADELGRVNIVSINNSGNPVNQIIASAVRDQRQRAVELDGLVGVHWLDSEKKLIIPRSIQDASLKPWESVTPLGPFHPVKMKSALVAVNGNGMLRLLAQTLDGQYTEVDALIPGAHYVTHAYFCQTSAESLLVVLANGDNSLMVYEAFIKWKPNNLESKQDFVNVEIHPVTSSQLPETFGPLRKLVAFRIIHNSALSEDVTIRAIYSKAVVEYHLKSSEESLHQSFFELFSASDPMPPNPYRAWQLVETRLDTPEFEILEYVVSRLVILAVFANGEVATESLVPSVSLLQADKVGLRFSAAELVGSAKDDDTKNSAVSICLSPTLSCAAIFYDDTPPAAPPKLISLQPSGDKLDSEQAERMALALATGYACTVFNSEQCDDILRVCWRVLHDPSAAEQASLMFASLASNTQRLLNVQLYAPEDSYKLERLVVTPSPSQRWLSFLIALGTSSNWRRSPGCYASLSLLHLQILVFGLTWTLKRVSQRTKAQNVEQLRLEIQASQFHLSSMLGPVRWALDLIVRICQELYDISCRGDYMGVTEKPNVYVSLLMSSIARYLLRYFLRVVHSLSTTAKNLADQEARLNAKISQTSQVAKDPSLAHDLRAKLASPSNYTATRTFKKLVSQLQAVPVKLDAFEKILNNLDDGIKALAAKIPLNENQRKSIDADLIKTAQIPGALSPLVRSLIESARSILFPSTDIPNLYFYDASWISLDPVDTNEVVDGLRKRIVLPHEQTQTCARCGMKSVVGHDQMKQAPQWLVLFQRYCVCGGSWVRTSVPLM